VKLPTKFTLAGSEYQVDYKADIEPCGTTWRDRYLVQIKASLEQRAKETTFCHELVHCILFAMGKQQHDEEFVDGFANLLHQYMKTQK